MRKIEFWQNYNEHITEIFATVSAEGEEPKANICFTNLGYGTVDSVKLMARGYNSFGELVKVDGEDKFFILLQDLNVKKNTKAEKSNISLPDNSIRRLELSEQMVHYAEGFVMELGEDEIVSFEADVFDKSIKKELQALTVLRDYERTAICLPEQREDCWLCVCGRLNKNDAEECAKCSKKKSETFEKCTMANIDNKVKKYKTMKTVKVSAVVFSALLILFSAFAIYITSTRQVFMSKEEMLNYLQGTWAYVTDDCVMAYSFDGEKVTDSTYYNSDLVERETNIDYYPLLGVFKDYKSFTISKNGFLIDNKYKNIYYKHESVQAAIEQMEILSGEYQKIHENGYDVLRITDVDWNKRDRYGSISATLKNNGLNEYKYIKVAAVFKDAFGEIVASDWTYAVNSVPLEPGESKSFSISMDTYYENANSLELKVISFN